MPFYFVLSLATLAILTLGVAVFRKTRSFAFVYGMLFLYYWSLYGSWFIIHERLTMEQAKFDYLYYKLFPVELNDTYLYSIVLYAVFVIAAQLAVLGLAQGKPKTNPPVLNSIGISHWKLVAMTGMMALIAYF